MTEHTAFNARSFSFAFERVQYLCELMRGYAMSDFITIPAVFFGIMGACTLIGVLIGLKMHRKTDLEPVKKHAFQAGRKEGLREGDELLKQFKDDMAGDMGKQLGAMRTGMIQTIKAYQQAVSTCGERLSVPYDQRKSLLPPVEPEDISGEGEVESTADIQVEPEAVNQEDSDLESKTAEVG